VGEHLGYLFTALWTIFFGLAILKLPTYRPWLAWTGITLAIGILFGLLEPAGFAWAGMVNFFAYTLWAFWLIGLGIAVIRNRSSGLSHQNQLGGDS
jgi:hypothetical protein